MDAGLREALLKTTELDLAVIGRKSRKEISRPVWFVIRGDSLLFLPVSGRATQWFRNLQSNPLVKLRVGPRTFESRAKLVTEKGAVRDIIDLFTEKYGEEDMRRYYSKLDAAVEVEPR